jgi:hypothetical protein
MIPSDNCLDSGGQNLYSVMSSVMSLTIIPSDNCLDSSGQSLYSVMYWDWQWGQFVAMAGGIFDPTV